MKIAALSQIGCVARSLYLFLAELVDFVHSGLKFLLDRQSDFESQGSDAFHQQLADGFVDVLSHDMLANGDGMFDAVTLANIIWYESALASVVSNRHPASAAATDHHALQQSRPLTGRTFAAVGADRLCILPEAQQVFFVLLPGDVTGVGVLE